MITSDKTLHFENREDGGRQLAKQFLSYIDTGVVIYALPRGGVVTAVEISRELHAPLDLIIPRKIGPPIDATGKIAIIVDDGIATGLTMKCAIAELRHRHPKKIIVAVPIASADSLEEISTLVDEVVCLSAPKLLNSIGSFYNSFPQVEDAEVIELMHST